MYELLIIGGGPSGVAAGIYAARKKIKFILVTDFFGGQSITSLNIENWIGERSINGSKLASNLEEHLKAQEQVDVIDGDRVNNIQESSSLRGGDFFKIQTEDGQKLEAISILVASGSKRRKLGVPGEERLTGRGVVFCATCDAPFFKNEDVAVVGGGNSALEAVIDLLPFVNKVYLIHRRDEFRGDPLIFEKIAREKEKVEMVLSTEVVEILGKEKVTALLCKNKLNSKELTFPIGGVFVEIGSIPNSEIVEDFVDLNERREIKVDHKTKKTSHCRIWAAGDVTDSLYKQNNISVGDGVVALLNICDFLKLR